MNDVQAEKFALITPSTLCVGIDVAKQRHVSRCVNFRGESLSKPFQFENTKEGFRRLLDSLRSLMKNSGCTEILVGMEPTGVYWLPLAYWLQRQGIKVVQVSCLAVHRSKELDDNSPTKNDNKDALVIARLVKDARFTEVHLPQGDYADLRNLTILRGQLKEKKKQLLCQIRAWLTRFFPEFESVFDDLDRIAAQVALRQFPLPTDVLALGEEKVGQAFRQATRGRVWRSHALALVEAAHDSVGLTTGLASGRLQLECLLDLLNLLQRQIDQVEEQLVATFSALPVAALLLTIPGLSPVMAAVLVAELGDLRRFRHPKQLQKMAGLALRESSSGSHQGLKRINKRGRRRLRATLYLIVLGLVHHDPIFKALHQRLKSRPVRPLTGKQSIVALCTKFLGLLFAIVKNQQPYDPERLRPKNLPAAA